MLSHVEMAPAAGGFKLFGKVITQCAESAPPAAAPQEPPALAASRGREREDADERDQPVVKREVPADHADASLLADRRHHHPGGGGLVGVPAPAAESAESKGQHQHPRGGAARQGQGQGQQQETAEARAAAAASSAPPLPCPRCRSRNTKFCYFNNYNVNQPRHFCKDCHRYWTAGGALRNVPVGAGRRKNRPLGPVVAVPAAAAAAAHHHHQQHLQHHHRAVAAAGFVLGFPGQQHPPSPTSPPAVYADRWPVCPERPLF